MVQLFVFLLIYHFSKNIELLLNMYSNKFLIICIQKSDNLVLSMFSSARCNSLNYEEYIIHENETDENNVTKKTIECNTAKSKNL